PYIGLYLPGKIGAHSKSSNIPPKLVQQFFSRRVFDPGNDNWVEPSSLRALVPNRTAVWCINSKSCSGTKGIDTASHPYIQPGQEPSKSAYFPSKLLCMQRSISDVPPSFSILFQIHINNIV